MMCQNVDFYIVTCCTSLFDQDKIHNVLRNSRTATNKEIITIQKKPYDIYIGSV